MTTHTGSVVCNITMSADGYVAGPHQTEERPFGDDGDVPRAAMTYPPCAPHEASDPSTRQTVSDPACKEE